MHAHNAPCCHDGRTRQCTEGEGVGGSLARAHTGGRARSPAKKKRSKKRAQPVQSPDVKLRTVVRAAPHKLQHAKRSPKRSPTKKRATDGAHREPSSLTTSPVHAIHTPASLLASPVEFGGASSPRRSSVVGETDQEHSLRQLRQKMAVMQVQHAKQVRQLKLQLEQAEAGGSRAASTVPLAASSPMAEALEARVTQLEFSILTNALEAAQGAGRAAPPKLNIPLITIEAPAKAKAAPAVAQAAKVPPPIKARSPTKPTQPVAAAPPAAITAMYTAATANAAGGDGDGDGDDTEVDSELAEIRARILNAKQALKTVEEAKRKTEADLKEAVKRATPLSEEQAASLKEIQSGMQKQADEAARSRQDSQLEIEHLKIELDDLGGLGHHSPLRKKKAPPPVGARVTIAEARFPALGESSDGAPGKAVARAPPGRSEPGSFAAEAEAKRLALEVKAGGAGATASSPHAPPPVARRRGWQAKKKQT